VSAENHPALLALVFWALGLIGILQYPLATARVFSSIDLAAWLVMPRQRRLPWWMQSDGEGFIE